jgi:hypothetical protein
MSFRIEDHLEFIELFQMGFSYGQWEKKETGGV